MKRIALMCLLFGIAAVTALANQGPPQDHDVPEIDPSSIAAATALVGVGVLMVRGRQKG